MTHRIKVKSTVDSQQSTVKGREPTVNGRQPTVKNKKAWLLGLLFLAVNCGLSTVDCFPATKVFLKNATSKLGDGTGMVSSTMRFRNASATQGSSAASDTINSIGGTVTGQYWPSSTTGHILTTTAGGSIRETWVSAPLASGVTISGTITPNLWGLESNAACNCGARYEVLRWSVKDGGIVSSLGISTDDGVTEWGTTSAVRTAPTLTPTSTAFVTGDRIVIVIYNDDGNAVTEASGRTWTFYFDGATGVNGDTYLSFTETITFSADSNNGRPRPLTSRVRQLIRRPTDWLTDFSLLLRSAEEWGF